MTFRCRYRSFVASTLGVNAIVLWPFVFFRNPKYGVTRRLFRHELEHCYQVERMGVARFYLRYIYEMIRWKHSERPLEDEARAAETKALTPEEVVWYKSGRIEL